MVAMQTDLKRRQILASVGTAAALVLLGGGVTCAVLGGGGSPNDQKASPTSNHVGCRECLKLLPEFRRNELEPELMGKVAAHLNVCSYCYNQNHQGREAGA